MIISALFELVYNLIDLFVTIDIPPLPETVYEYLNPLFDYLLAGAGILANYTPFTYIMSLFMIIVAIDIGVAVYHFIMWVLKKIPVLGIE